MTHMTLPSVVSQSSAQEEVSLCNVEYFVRRQCFNLLLSTSAAGVFKLQLLLFKCLLIGYQSHMMMMMMMIFIMMIFKMFKLFHVKQENNGNQRYVTRGTTT